MEDIEHIINKRQNKSSSDSLTTGGIAVSNKNDIADGFNHFFANIGKELAAKIDPPANDDASINDYLEDKNSLFLSPISEDEVIGIIKTCNHKTSTDSNDLSMSIIKKIFNPLHCLWQQYLTCTFKQMSFLLVWN